MLLGVDVGGTFTDAVLVGADSRIHTAKVPSTPSEEAVAVLEAIRILLADAGVAAEQVERFAHGMTVATNALLEGRTARTALIATAGFTDVIELGRQARPDLYRLSLSAPPPLVDADLRFAAPERTGPEGPLLALDPGLARALVEEVALAEPQAVAVSLLHSYAHPAHERLFAELLSELLPGVHVSLSHDLVGTFREYERTATTVLDAALSPLLGGYLRRLSDEALARGLPAPQIMQSSGGLTDADRAAAHAALTVLSGPAGGVGGALLLAGLADAPNVLCFDMGGTSCDVCLIERSQVGETAERAIAGRPLALPALDIHTVGAGGGSIAWRDPGGALRVGPASAGATPGPACYGRGGSRPTVTDANLLLGRLLADQPLPGDLVLDREAAELAVGRLAEELGLELLECARGIIRVAEAEMLGALRLMTVERGIDPRDFVLMPFGGAGPLHAASLARALGISRILCPRASGVLCALGLAAAAPRRDVSRTVMLGGLGECGGGPGEGAHARAHARARVQAERDTLIERATRALGTPPASIRVRHELRYRGQSFELAVEEAPATPEGRPASPVDLSALLEAFAEAHEERYGYRDEEAEVELVNIRVSALGEPPSLSALAGAERRPIAGTAKIVFDGDRADRIDSIEATVMMGAPPPGTRVSGPAVCALGEATLLVPPGWSGEADAHGTLHLLDTPGGEWENVADGTG
jgi:N-methylhydantoinase A